MSVRGVGWDSFKLVRQGGLWADPNFGLQACQIQWTPKAHTHS